LDLFAEIYITTNCLRLLNGLLYISDKSTNSINAYDTHYEFKLLFTYKLNFTNKLDHIKCFTPTEKNIFISCDSTPYVYIIGSSKQEELKTENLLSPIMNLEYGNNLVFGVNYEVSIFVWEADSAKLINRLYGHKNSVSAIIFYKDLLISGSWDCNIIVWEINNNFCIKQKFYLNEAIHSFQIRGRKILVDTISKKMCSYSIINEKIEFYSEISKNKNY